MLLHPRYHSQQLNPAALEQAKKKLLELTERTEDTNRMGPVIKEITSKPSSAAVHRRFVEEHLMISVSNSICMLSIGISEGLSG
jgi:hypothetical protein